MSVRLVPAAQTLSKLTSGFDQLADLLALTLGPQRGTILCSSGSAPEILSESGVIARRVVGLSDRAEDVGAMLLRAMAWQLHETVGDGVATAAVLARAMVHEASKRIAAGANPILLRRGIERGVAAAVQTLESQAVPASGQAALIQLAENVTGDAPLSRILGEMFHLLGADAALEIEEFAAPYLDYAYLEGGRWRARAAARAFIPDGQPEAILENALVLAVDQPLERVDQVRPILEWVAGPLSKSPLLLVAPEICGDALTTLTVNHTRGNLIIGAAVLTSVSAHLGDDLEDIVALTGGKPFLSLDGRPLEALQPGHFGRARRILLARDQLTIIGGKGEPRIRQARIEMLRGQMTAPDCTPDQTERFQKRIARLNGGVGILKIGAYSEPERERQKALTHKARRALAHALREGLVIGGGVAYLNCIQAVLNAREDCTEPDQASGVAVLGAALEAPFRQIVQNHGQVPPAVALDEVRRMGIGWGFDAQRSNYACLPDIGVMDSLSVVRGALLAAASTAGTAITVGRMVLHADPQVRR